MTLGKQADFSRRSRVFTATWPWLADGNGEFRAGRGRVDDSHDPFCQVTIQMVRNPSSSTSTSGEPPVDEAAVVLFSEKLSIRSYNGISLANEGRYRLSLTDCCLWIPGSGTIDESSLLDKLQHDEGKDNAKGIRIPILSVPFSLTFDVYDKVQNEGFVIGNVRLFPVIYGPVASSPVYPLYDPVPDRAGGQTLATTLSLEQSHATDLPRQHVDTYECGKNGTVVALTNTTAAVVGTAFIFLLLATWWAAKLNVNHLGTFRGRALLGWRCIIDCGRNRTRRNKKQREELEDQSPPMADIAEMSDASSDSDTILNGSVPDPVDLPRNEEDWRSLFDTLYQQEKEEASMAAAAASVGRAGEYDHTPSDDSRSAIGMAHSDQLAAKAATGPPTAVLLRIVEKNESDDE